MFCFNFHFFTTSMSRKFNSNPEQRMTKSIPNSNPNQSIQLVDLLLNKLSGIIFSLSQQWCQKWDSHVRYSGDSLIIFTKQLYLHIYFLILNKYYSTDHKFLTFFYKTKTEISY